MKSNFALWSSISENERVNIKHFIHPFTNSRQIDKIESWVKWPWNSESISFWACILHIIYLFQMHFETLAKINTYSICSKSKYKLRVGLLFFADQCKYINCPLFNQLFPLESFSWPKVWSLYALLINIRSSTNFQY